MLTFPSILLKTTKTTPVTGFFLGSLHLVFLFFLFCAVRAAAKSIAFDRARVDES